MTDIKLIKKYKHGDAGAFEIFYQRYCDRLYSFIRQRTGESRAGDIFQNTFCKFIDVVVGKDLTNPKSYLFTIALNNIRNQGRDNSRNSISFDENFYTDEDIFSNGMIEKLETGVSEHLLSKGLIKLQKKKPVFYNILNLHIFQEMTFDEISEIEKINRNTVSSRYVYAIKHLKKYCGQK